MIYWLKPQSRRISPRPKTSEIQYGGAYCHRLVLSLMKIPLFRVSPPPSPHGEGLSFWKVLSLHVFGRGFASWRHPRLRSVLWLAQQLPVGSAALAKNLPHRSRENEFTDGRVGRFWKEKTTCPLRVRTGYTSGRESVTAPLPGKRIAPGWRTGLDGLYGFGSSRTTGEVAAKDLRAFCAVRGCLTPLTPSAHPPGSKRPKTLAAAGGRPVTRFLHRFRNQATGRGGIRPHWFKLVPLSRRASFRLTLKTVSDTI